MGYDEEPPTKIGSKFDPEVEIFDIWGVKNREKVEKMQKTIEHRLFFFLVSFVRWTTFNNPFVLQQSVDPEEFFSKIYLFFFYLFMFFIFLICIYFIFYFVFFLFFFYFLFFLFIFFLFFFYFSYFFVFIYLFIFYCFLFFVFFYLFFIVFYFLFFFYLFILIYWVNKHSYDWKPFII